MLGVCLFCIGLSGSWLEAGLRSGLGVQVLGKMGSVFLGMSLSEADLKALLAISRPARSSAIQSVASEAHLYYFLLARPAVSSLSGSRSRWIGG